jgi:HlyD family secretion protein
MSMRGPTTRARRAALFLVLAGTAAVAAALIGLTAHNAAPPAPPPAAGATLVLTAPARRGPIERTVPISGSIKTELEVQLAARSPARVLAVPVREGDRVRRGQLLVRLDDRDARAALEAASAGTRAAEAALAKTRSGAVIRRVEVDSGVTNAAAAVKAGRAKLEQARGASRAAEAEAAAEQCRAQAALDAARANLATATRGPRPAQLRQSEAAVKQAEAGAQAAQRALESAQFLYDRGGLTRARLQEAQAADETARAQLETARAALDLAREGATPEERRAAEAAVRQAEAGVESARAGERRSRLARQDAAAAMAQLLQAEAALRAARAGTAGSEIAREDTRAAAAALEQARVQEQQARDQFLATRLVSPADGVVTLRGVEPGQIAQPGQPLVAVASGPLIFEGAVSSTTVVQLRPGQPIDLTTDAAPGHRSRAVLRDVPSTPGPDGRTFTVRAPLSDRDAGRARAAGQSQGSSRGGSPRRAGLAPGMRARGTVHVAFVANAILVPPEAVIHAPEGAFVWVARAGRADRRAVGIGLETDSAVQILSGIDDGEAVVVSGAEDLRPGSPVSPIQRESRGVGDMLRRVAPIRPERRKPNAQPPGAERPWA